jgi:hypothetical protein
VHKKCSINSKIENQCLTLGLSTKNTPSNTKWVLDSGATDHITGNPQLFNSFHEINDDHFFMVASNEKIKIKG